MRVLFDAYWWHAGPPSNRSVMRSLVEAWVEFFPEDEIVLAVHGSTRGISAGARVPPRVLNLHSRPHGVAIALELGRLARRVDADVVVTHNFAPLGASSVVLIHDFLFLDHPEWFSLPERIYFSGMRWTSRRAAHAVVATSQTEADRLQRHMPGGPPVTSIGLAVPRNLLAATPTRPPLVGDSFLLTVARLNARKNLERLASACMSTSTVTPQRPLVVVGQPQEFQDSDGVALGQAVAAGVVVLLPGVSDGELKWLYQHCAAFIFPTLGEGYGLPPVEAAAFGAPVAASDIPVMREVLHGSAARFFDPYSIPDIATTIAELLERQPTRSDVVSPVDGWKAVTERLRNVCVNTTPRLR